MHGIIWIHVLTSSTNFLGNTAHLLANLSRFIFLQYCSWLFDWGNSIELYNYMKIDMLHKKTQFIWACMYVPHIAISWIEHYLLFIILGHVRWIYCLVCLCYFLFYFNCIFFFKCLLLYNWIQRLSSQLLDIIIFDYNMPEPRNFLFKAIIEIW